MSIADILKDLNLIGFETYKDNYKNKDEFIQNNKKLEEQINKFKFTEKSKTFKGHYIDERFKIADAFEYDYFYKIQKIKNSNGYT